MLLNDDDIHIYAAEAWAKYTGACDYDQDMHRDYLNHTLLVPSTTTGCRQVEMFVFLNDVPAELGPPHLLSRRHTADLPAVPNWLLRSRQETSWRYVDAGGHPELYEAEVSGAGPAGTVIAFEPGTFHRGTQLTAPPWRAVQPAPGFPPPGHPYWTPETLAGMALRYPLLDLSPWHPAR